MKAQKYGIEMWLARVWGCLWLWFMVGDLGLEIPFFGGQGQLSVVEWFGIAVFVFVVWNLVLGIWYLEFGAWNLEFGAWYLIFIYQIS
ncbi:MAG: hypothetical protein WBA61_11455 [Aequorivita sp.]